MAAVEMKADQELDLRGVLCPYNYVKTKLKLESMTLGQVLAVTIDEGEPERNVPRSLLDEGQRVLRLERVGGAVRLLIEKTA